MQIQSESAPWMFTYSNFLDLGYCLLLQIALQQPFIELSSRRCLVRPERLLKSILGAPESISEALHVKGAAFSEPRAAHMSV